LLSVSAPSLLLDGRLTGPGTVVVEGGVVVEVRGGELRGDDRPAGSAGEHVTLESGVLTAGLVDLQINGAWGVDLATATPEEWASVAERLPETGVTAFLPTYTTAAVPDLVAGLDRAARARAARSGTAARLLGVHLEGPFLSPLHAGAHDPSLMHDPTQELLDELLAGEDRRQVLSVVTLAPERPGALAAIRRLVAAGVVASIGHSAASAEQTAAAADAGARLVTHLFNAQSALGHREPGLPGHALADERLTLGLIADLQHVAPDVLRLVFAAAAHRVALVTDAVAAAGMPAGEYLLGGQPVRVDPAEGLPRRTDGTIAGSVLHLDAAVRNVIGLGVSPAAALTSATAVPASVVGRSDLGRIVVDAPADLVWWDESYVPRRVWVAGSAVPPIDQAARSSRR